jgi:hypothetical protein
MQRRWLNSKRIVVLALAALLLLASPAAMLGKNSGNDIEGVMPPQARILGKSREEWSAEWWRWVWSQTAHDHPLFDGTTLDAFKPFDLPGSSCDHDQRGQVWFLAGTFGGDANRTCTIPRDKFVFFPILNSDTDNEVDPPTNYDVKKLRQLCLDTVANPTLSVTLDKGTLRNSESYAITPTTFSYKVPDDPDNIYRALVGIDFAGTVSPAVSCGYYVMLKPMDQGTHRLTLAATNGDGSFSYKVEYTLKVVNPGGR